MDAAEIKRLYYLLMVDGRKEKRDEAAERLSASDDPLLKKLAAIGEGISKVINDQADPDTLPAALKGFDDFPVNEFWRSFMAATGEVLIKKAQQSPKDREKLIGHALDVIVLSQSGGFTLSESTAKLVESVKDEKTGVARFILAENTRNTAVLPRTFRSSAPKREKRRRRRTNVT